MTLANYQYSLGQFVADIARGEAVNLGVIVVDDTAAVAHSAFLRDIQRKVTALAPGFDTAVLRRLIERLHRRAAGAFQPSFGVPLDARIRSSEHLRVLAATMKNQLQITEPKAYRATSLDTATDELFAELVEPIGQMVQEGEPSESAMPLARLRAMIWRTIKEWGQEVEEWKPEEGRPPPPTPQIQIVKSGLERGADAQHYADFWLQMGQPVAALFAIPENPDERHVAWARRDSMPTIVSEFRKLNDSFTAVAVFPPNGHHLTPFVIETQAFLGSMEGVLVVRADELEEARDQIVPSLT